MKKIAPKKLTLLVALVGILPSLYAQTQKQNPFSFEASYLGDFYGNATGGIETGVGFMGMANIKVGFDTGEACWWRGGSFFLNGASIHGKSLSEHYLGDLQIASNIDAGEHTYLHELWFRQQLGPVSFTVGLQDLNADFMVSENAGEFINSSFGVPPVISVNIPVPIFPLTGLGVSARWDITERFAWQAALFDGDQTPFENNRYNLKWSLNARDGLLAMTEFHFDERFKLGAYYHSGEKNGGVYFMGDQRILERENHRLDLFAQIAVAPKGLNETNYSIALGANLFGVFSKRQRDAVGLAATHAGLHRTGHKHETAIELYYKYAFSDNITLQPDIQYIVNPSATETPLKNALACILRLHLNF
uniref:Putative carbohydrate-selective porin n=1 Tax=termite gut metagenome TaxID=433724 RepID=S0DFQ0_9ZZZZ